MMPWPCFKIKDLTTKVGSGATPRGGEASYKEHGIPLIRSLNVHSDGFRHEGLAFLDERQAEELKSAEVRQGDVLLNITGASIGRVTQAPPDLDSARVSQHVCIIRPIEVLRPSFLRWYLASPPQQSLIMREQTGATRQGLTKEKILQFDVPVPSLNEQHRIVAKIEELFSDLDAGVAALNRAKAKLKRYRAAVLKSAVEGKLTTEWRAKHPKTEPASKLLERILTERRKKWEADQLAKFTAAEKEPPKNWKSKYVEPSLPDETELPTLPEGWCWASAEQLTVLITKGSSPGWQGFDYVESGVLFLRSQNVRWGSVDLADVVYLPKAFNDSHKNSIIREGDVLLNLVGASIGRSAVAPREIDGANTNQAVGIIRLIPEGLRCDLMMFLLLSPQLQAYIAKTKADVARANFNLDDVRPTPIPLPPPSEQQQIVAEAEERLSQITAAEHQIEANLLRASRLRQSILKQAFEGTIVSQDPNHEPASKLLNRISNGKPNQTLTGCNEGGLIAESGSHQSRQRRTKHA